MINLAVIGIGRWGKNLLREFNKITEVTYCYARSAENRQWLKKNYPNIEAAESYDDILNNPNIDAVVIATPIETHFELARRALESGKHTFVEKPITAIPAQAEKLVSLAKKNKLILFVGHTFLYHPVFQKIKELTKNDPLIYAKFSWNKLGSFNEDVVWNLACHDVAMAINLFGEPKKVKLLSAKGLVTKRDIISLELNFSGNRAATIEINRVSDLKNKLVTIATKNNVYSWDNDSLYKLDRAPGEFKEIYHSETQPLEIECQAFLDAIEKKSPFPTDGTLGLAVVNAIAHL